MRKINCCHLLLWAFFSLMGIGLGACQQYETESSPSQGKLQIKLNLPEPETAVEEARPSSEEEIRQRVFDVASSVQTIVVSVRRLEGESLGAYNATKMIYPAQNLDDEIAFLLDPGRVKIFVYAYNQVLFQAGGFFPNSNLKDLIFFGVSDEIEIKAGTSQETPLMLKNFSYTKVYAEHVTLRQESEGKYRLKFELPTTLGNLDLFWQYGVSHQRPFNQTLKLVESPQQSLLLTSETIPHYMARFNITSEDGELFKSSTIYCPVESCGRAPLRIGLGPLRQLKARSYSDGFRIKMRHNRLDEDVRAKLYFSEAPWSAQTLKLLQAHDETALRQQQIYSYTIPDWIKPLQEYEAYVTSETWATLGTSINLAELKQLFFTYYMESPSGREYEYHRHCNDLGQNPTFKDGFPGNYCYTAPFIQSLTRTANNSGFIITWGIYPFAGQNVTTGATSFKVDLEIYDPQWQAVKILKDQNAVVGQPANLLLYQVPVDYAAAGLANTVNYWVRLRLEGQAGPFFQLGQAPAIAQGGATIAAPTALDEIIHNNAGILVNNSGTDDYFSLKLAAESSVEVVILGVTAEGKQTFLTPQLLDLQGKPLPATITSNVSYIYSSQLTGTYLLKVLKPSAEFVPLTYRLLVNVVDYGNDQVEPPLVTMPNRLAAPRLNANRTYNAEAPELVAIRAGSFERGGSQGSEDAKTAQRITLTRDFYISNHEVTVGEYRRFKPDAAAVNSGCYTDDCPMVRIFWREAQAYTTWLNNNRPLENGLKYRLCSEAEWEYAARAGTSSRWSCGDSPECLNEIGWYDFNAEGHAWPVKSLQPNPWGLYDMHGNIMEWVQDAYAAYPATSENPVNANEAATAFVLRGGSWYSSASLAGAAYRYYELKDNKTEYIGFRVCASQP